MAQVRRSRPFRSYRPFSPNTLATAAAIALCLGGASARAAIVPSGLVSPDPSSGNVPGFLSVGTTGLGSVLVNGGSALQAGRIDAGGQRSGNGSVVVSGAGSSITADIGAVSNTFNTNIGSQGTGSLSVLNGASFVNGANDANCQLRCQLKVSNAAGSDGTLLVQGAGSTLNTAGGVQVGWVSRFTTAVAGFDYGVLGGATQGRATVEAGGHVSSSSLTISARDMSTEVRPADTSVGQVVVDGIGSVWNLVRNATQAGAQALLRLSTTSETNGSLTVSNGGVVRLDGSAAPTESSGINVGNAAGADASNSSGTINVTGAGSRLEFTGGNGFFNLGRGNGNVAQMTVSAGGVVTGNTEHAFGFMSVGRGGATGTLNVDGNGSLIRMSGADAVNGGAFLNVGRTDVTAGTGTVNVRNGGRIEIDDRGQVLTSGNQTGMIVGNGASSLGSMSISGPGSTAMIAGDSGRTPYVGVGRDGGTGSLTVSNGGRLEMSSTHLSVPTSGSTYLPGDAVILTVGQRFAGNDGLPSTGTLTVTGAGSEVVMSGVADRLIQVGAGSGGSGALNIANGGTVRSLALLVGNGAGATGTVTMNAGQLFLDGNRNGGPSPGGAGLSIGRGDGGTGLMTVTNGSSVAITTTAPDGGIGVGGSTVNPGGNGTLLINGGSSVTVDGPSVAVTAGSQGTQANPGNGLIVLSGAGTSMSVTGAQARVLAGNFAGSSGTIQVGAGATLSTSGLVGVAHNGTGASGGNGLLLVDGTVNAQQVFVAPGGILAGNGTINAGVINQGGIHVGHSPGRMTFNGAFDSSAGQILIEVEAQPGGGFAVDELVFGDPANVVIGGADIVFQFLGDTDPAAFLAAGLFDLATFFKGSDGQGGVETLDDSFYRDGFVGATFSAASDGFVIRNFSFDPLDGARFDASAVPEPGVLALLMLALPLLLLRRRLSATGTRVPAQALLA